MFFLVSQKALELGLPPWTAPRGLEALVVWIKLSESGGLSVEELVRQLPELPAKSTRFFLDLLFVEGFAYKAWEGKFRACPFQQAGVDDCVTERRPFSFKEFCSFYDGILDAIGLEKMRLLHALYQSSFNGISFCTIDPAHVAKNKAKPKKEIKAAFLKTTFTPSLESVELRSKNIGFEMAPESILKKKMSGILFLSGKNGRSLPELIGKWEALGENLSEDSSFCFCTHQVDNNDYLLYGDMNIG